MDTNKDGKVMIKVENVSKTFVLPHERKDSIVEYITSPLKSIGSPQEKFEVLKNVNFEIKEGQFVGIMGKNGSGKSTLLKILAGIYLPTTGNVTLNGNIIPFLELGVGFNYELSGRDNIYFNGVILGMNTKYLKSKFDEIVAFAELERFIDLPLKNYSSGMKVRLAFSIAIMASADIYLLDEVLAVGDVQFQQKCLKVFDNFRKERKTIILVTHTVDLVRKYCDNAMLIENGIVETELEKEKVISRYKQ
ncbi:ABC transporter ATP-binding protein [Candidatus Dojkabacteria bacterium]|jgi:ABC-2 type transport system ATP-binding protein|nr:ABC transporter ATP-binding protein [Candidatus Dojkabacteria bacterium]